MLYSMSVQSEKKEVIKEIMPRDESNEHHETLEVSIRPAEHIVAGRIDVA